jgi:hypothetical protein
MNLIRELSYKIDNIQKITPKEEGNTIEISLDGYRNAPKLRTYMRHNNYECMDTEFHDGTYTLKFELLTIPAEILANKIEIISEQDYHREFNYVELNDYDDTRIILDYSVKGGYEADVNAYYGATEYVEDFIKVIKEVPGITSASYNLDEEDLTGELILEYSH